jgi:hypothetical protein
MLVKSDLTSKLAITRSQTHAQTPTSDFKILSSGTSEWDLLIRESLLISQLSPVLKGIRQYIFLLFHLEELLKSYVNLFYRFCVTLLFLEIFEQNSKKPQISELSAILDFGGYACDIISRVTQEFYP